MSRQTTENFSKQWSDDFVIARLSVGSYALPKFYNAIQGTEVDLRMQNKDLRFLT